MMPFLTVMMLAHAAAVAEISAANAEAKAQGWVSQTARQIAAAKALAEISACLPK